MKKDFVKMLVILCICLFNPISTIAEEYSKNYRLSASDKISIRVFNEENLNLETRLGNSGIISYPLLGEIDVNGLTLREVEIVITAGLKGPYLLDPKVTVTIIEYRSFFVNGEVTKPGGYPYQPGLTVRKAIALAGGLSENASQELHVIREDDRAKVSMKAQFDTVVNAGDIVIVKEYQQVYVNGEVRKPGGYSFTPGLTMRKAIALAGGFTERASREKVYVIHEGDQSENAKKGNLEDIIRPGDIITIKQSFF